MRRGVDFDALYLAYERVERAKIVDGKWVANDPEEQEYIDEICEVEDFLGCQLENGDNVEFILLKDLPEYAKHYVEDRDDIDTDEWPYCEINWESASEIFEETCMERYVLFENTYLIWRRDL